MVRNDDSVASLRGINQRTYDKLALRYIVDYEFWQRVYVLTRHGEEKTLFPPLKTMAEALDIVARQRPKLFTRKAIATFQRNGGLDNATPLEFLFLHFATFRPAIWAATSTPKVQPLPSILHAVDQEEIDAQYAMRFVVGLYCDSIDRGEVSVFQENTVDLIIMGKDSPKEWVYAGMNWMPSKHQSVEVFMGGFKKLMPYVSDV